MRCFPLGLLMLAACASGSPGDTEGDDRGLELAPTSLALHEVAYLYPLPAKGDEGLIPASHDLGSGSAKSLLPATIVDKLGSLIAGEPNSSTYESLRVVSMRLEPCFRASSEGGCERQLRFVFQPISIDPSGVLPTTTLDAAVHVVYSLPRAAFVDLVHGIVAGRAASGSTPAPGSALGVHPVLASEGLSGPYARALEGLVIAAASKGRIVRVTFLGTRGRGNEWQLGGVNVTNDETTSPLPIPSSSSSGARIQSIVLQRSGESTFAKSIAPASSGTDDISLLLDSSAAGAAPRDDVARALHAANRIENPDLRTSENTDCATCHTVASSRVWAEQKLALRDDRDRFIAPGFDLSVTTSRPIGDLGALRALGYFGADPVVSPRAIHDTAKAAQWIAASDRTRR